MIVSDLFLLALKTIFAQPFRATLIIIAMTIGISSVSILTALGESARSFVVGEFQALGTNLLIMMPGRSETVGGQPPVLGETPRDLTLDDAKAIAQIPLLKAIAPITIGSAPVSTAGLEREATIMGSSAALREVRHLDLARGQFIPTMDFDKAAPVCVIGQTIKEELFANRQSLGEWLRINDRRYRVIGVLGNTGQSVGVGFDEIVIIPIASAQMLFNNYSLFRILAEAKSQQAMYQASEQIRKIIKLRHEGEDDITIITQDSVVQTFNDILLSLTLAVTGIAGISLVVAGVLIMNVMLVSVTQRTAEIGLLKALGAGRRQILALFLTEAAMLSLTGAVLGILTGQAALHLLELIYPDFTFILPLWAQLAALLIAVVTALVFGVMPAYKAAALDPITALNRH